MIQVGLAQDSPQGLLPKLQALSLPSVLWSKRKTFVFLVLVLFFGPGRD